MVTLVIDPEAVAVMERMLAELGQLNVVPADIAARDRYVISMEIYTYKRNLNCSISDSRSDGVLLTSLPQDT